MNMTSIGSNIIKQNLMSPAPVGVKSKAAQAILSQNKPPMYARSSQQSSRYNNQNNDEADYSATIGSPDRR